VTPSAFSPVTTSKICCDDDRREAHRRFVEQQAGRSAHQRARHGQHLLLAARQAAGGQVALFLQDREHLEGVFHIPLDPVVGEQR
jgi:hypothetical protein